MVIGLIPGNDIVLGDFKRPYHVCLQLGTDLDIRKAVLLDFSYEHLFIDFSVGLIRAGMVSFDL